MPVRAGTGQVVVGIVALCAVVACTPRGPLVSSSTPTPTAATASSPSAAVFRCSRVELSAVPATEIDAGDSVTFTATAYGCAPADYRFIWLQVGTGDWQLARDWGPSPSWTWNTLPFSPAEYSIVADARARNELGNGPDASTSLPVILTAPSPSATRVSPARTNGCAAVGITVAPRSPVTIGTLVFFKLGASGCVQPEYRLHILDVTTGIDTLRRDWAPSPDWAWDTTNMSPGRYVIQVDARASRTGLAGYVVDTSTQVELELVTPT